MDKVARNALAPLLLRLGLAVVFIFHGMGKVSPDKSWGTAWHPELSVALQAAVAWGEFLGGVALAIGFLTRLAALGIVGIMAGAIATVHWQFGFPGPKGWEYNFVLITMALAVALLGSGVLGLDYWLWPRKPEPAKSP